MNTRQPTERSFGVSVGGVLMAIAGVAWWRGGHESLVVALGAVGIALAGAGIVAPVTLRVPNRIWWRIAHLLGWMNARILLTLFFFVVLTPFALAQRIVGRNPLRASSRDSNWSPYTARHRNPKHYERLF